MTARQMPYDDEFDADGIEAWLGAGIYYGAALTEAASCRGQDVIVVGGGLSGLAASIYLARAGRTVTLFEKRRSLGGSGVSGASWDRSSSQA